MARLVLCLKDLVLVDVTEVEDDIVQGVGGDDPDCL